MPDIRDEIADEPALRGPATPPASSGEDTDGIWGEPALSGTPAAAESRKRHDSWVAAQWKGASAPMRTLAFIALALASGPFAVVCALLRETVGRGFLAIAVLAPVVEEAGKIAAPLTTLEKRPWLFSSGSSITVLCTLSGLVFASIENLLYFFVYIKNPTPEIIAWRLVVCTAMHVVCSTLSGFGLARVWRSASLRRGNGSDSPNSPTDIPSLAAPWIVAAVVLHALYNSSTVIWNLL